MPDYPGTFIALEGSDGSGKGTQFKLLSERLRAVGYEVETFDFPRYDQPSSHFVRRYLNGDYGPAGEISPYSASLFYALDRYEAAPLIRKALKAGKVVLSNRYVGSNMAHQGAKFASEAEQRGFFIWADSLEYQLLNIPRPSISLFLRLPAELSLRLIEERAARKSIALDQHEADIGHLHSAVATYDTLCRLFPKDFRAIDCAPDGQLLSVATVSDKLWEVIQPLLPEKPTQPARPGVVKFNEDRPQPPPEPKATVRETGDLKLSLLALLELAKAAAKPTLRKMASFDGRGGSYYLPRIEGQSALDYASYMEKLAGYKQQMSSAMQAKNLNNIEETLGLLLPMAAFVFVSPGEDGAVAARLEEKATSKSAAKSKWQKLAQDGLYGNISTDMEPITLLEALPRNEFDLLSDSLYGLSDLPRQQMQAGIESWAYERKYEALNDVLAGLDGTAAAHTRYRWDVVAEQGLLIELAFSGLLNDLRLQAPTARYGYDVPKLIEEAGLEGEYLECFDLSLEIFSKLQASDYAALAPYVTLGAHKVRFQFSCSLETLVKQPAYSSELFKNFRAQLLESISVSHPITAQWLKKQLEAKPPAKKTGRNRPRRRRPK